MTFKTALVTSTVLASAMFATQTLAQDTTTTDPQTFAQMAAGSNMFEIESSRLALHKGTSNEVKDFAQAMITDHEKAGADLMRAAGKDSVKVSTPLDAEHQAKLDGLNSAAAGDFDAAYLSAQLTAHETAVALFKNYSKKGPDGSLKNFAAATYPTLRTHLEHVQALSRK